MSLYVLNSNDNAKPELDRIILAYLSNETGEVLDYLEIYESTGEVNNLTSFYRDIFPGDNRGHFSDNCFGWEKAGCFEQDLYMDTIAALKSANRDDFYAGKGKAVLS